MEIGSRIIRHGNAAGVLEPLPESIAVIHRLGNDFHLGFREAVFCADSRMASTSGRRRTGSGAEVADSWLWRRRGLASVDSGGRYANLIYLTPRERHCLM